MNEEIEKLYGVLTRDGYYSKSIEEFKVKWQDESYKKKVYDVVKRDNLYTKDYNSFVSKYSPSEEIVKKKDLTELPSSVDQKRSSSVTAPQFKGPITSRSESSGLVDKKEEGIYQYGGRKDALYKFDGQKWYINPTGKGKFVELKDPDGKRSEILNKQAVKVQPKGKSSDQQVKDLEDLKDLSDKETADILGWDVAEVKKASQGTSGNKIKPIAADVVADVVVGDDAISTQANSLLKARLELGSDTDTEKINKRAKYYDAVSTQISLKNRGYDIDINGDLNSDKTVKALDIIKADRELYNAEESERNKFIVKINSEINKDLLSSEDKVDQLRSKFSKDGYVFQSFGGSVAGIGAGQGSLIKVKYSVGGAETREEVFKANDPELDMKLKSFMAQTYLKRSEKSAITGDDVDASDEMARFDYTSSLINKMAENPDKYGKTLVSEGVFVNHMKSTYQYLKDEKLSISSEYDNLKNRIAAFNQNPTESEREAINNEIHELSVREIRLNEKYDKARLAENNFSKVSAAYAVEKAKTGGLFSGLAAQFAQGLTNVGKMQADLAADILPYVVDAVDPMTRARLENEGYSNEQIRDYASKEIKSGVLRELKKGITNVASLGQTTQEYLEIGDRGVLEQTLGFLAESIGTAMSGGGSGALTKLAFFSQSYNGMSEQMIGEEFDRLSEHEKKLISVPYALTIGALERLGFKFTTTTSKNPVLNKLINSTIARTFSSIPKDASIQTIERAISESLTATMTRAGLRIVGGAVVEGAVEGTQQLGEISIKNIANSIIGLDKETGFEFFKDVPDITTIEGVKEALELSSVDFAYGALGGLIMSGGENALSSVKDMAYKQKSNEEFEAMYVSLLDPKLRALLDLDIQSKVESGEMTQQQADEQKEAMNTSASALNKIPQDLSVSRKKESFGLLLEKDKLTSEINGMDESLTVVQRERIKEINSELEAISRGVVIEETTTDQVSDQAIKEEVVTPEAKVVAEEGKKAEIVAIETNEPKSYSQALNEARDEMGKGGPGLELQVSPVSEQEAQQIVDEGGKIFMTEDGLAGAYVKKDGYMGGLFKSPKSKFKDVAKVLQQARIKAGGYFMDAYSTKLEDIYIKNGFRPVARLKFNEEFAPEGWDSEGSPLKTKPDVVFFAYDPEGKYSKGDGQYLEDYDQAYDIAKNFKPEQAVAPTEVTIENAEDFKRKAATESDNVNTPKIVQAAKSVMRALPGLKIHVHTTQESYLDAISKLEGKAKQQVEEDESGDRRSGGTYMNGEIHVDLSAPDVTARTVYHEAFHHALLTSGKAAGDMRSMVDGIKKALGSKHAELVSKIEEFEGMYSDSDGFTDMDRAEEFLSELGAVLAESSTSLDTNTLQRIANIINKISQKLIGRPIFSSNASRQEIIDFMNSISRGMARGEQILTEGITSSINPVSKKQRVKTSVGDGYKLSFVQESDIIDIESLIDDIASKDQKVWFWVADQLGRGMYDDAVIGESHYLDAGPSFALDPENRDKNIVWASGLDQKKLEKNISESDYIFIISGSPKASKLFNKQVYNLFIKRVGDFASFKKGVLKSSKLAGLNKFFSQFNSWEDIETGYFKETDKKPQEPARKWLLKTMESVRQKNTDLKKFIESRGGAIDIDSLRDEFYKDNGFDMNDVMIVLKPSGVGGKSKHSTYETDILGEVIGVPDKVVNAADIMPEEIYQSVRDLQRAQASQKIAPYGSGIKSVKSRSKRLSTKKRISGSNSKKQAIDDAKSKYDLSVNKRKNSHQQGVQAAIGDLQKSDWYKQADDTQREEAVREIKSFLGEKIKKAPSVAKVLGKPKDEKVTNNVRTLRNEFIKARGTAAREAKADLKTKQRAIVVAVNQMKRGGFITAQQASSLAKRIVMLNVDNAVHVEKFMSFAEKIFADAEYNQKLSNAKSLNTKIKKAMKSEGNQATSAAIAKEFSKIDPKAIEDIDMYIEMAEKVLGAVKPSRVKGLDVDFKTAMDFEVVSEYVDIAMTQQEEFKKSQMLAVYSSLEADGVISDDMSLKEMMEIVASINESEEGMPSNEKAAYIMAYVSKVFDTYSPIIKSMLRGTDPFTGDSVTITDKQGDIMQRLLKINVESMDIRDAIRIIEAMDNFSTNAITDGVEAIVSRYEGVMNAKSIADSGFKARETRTFGKRGQMFDSASLGRVWAQQMMTMKTLADLMFRGPVNAVKVLSDIGFSAFERGVSRATKVWNTSIDTYYNSFRKKKANGKKFMDADNIIERGMYASLRRTIAGDVKAVDAELKRKIKLIADSIEVLRLKGDVNQKALADIYEQTFNKLGLGDANITAADIESRVDQVNKQAVDWWIEEWSKHYGDLVDVSENVYNTKLGKDLFYTTDRFSSVSRDASIEEAIEKAGGGGFASAVGYEYDKKTGVLMPSTKPISMGGNRFLDLNFDMNNSKALKAALVDINTAAATRQINGALSSDHWIKIIPNAKDREMFRGRVDNYILRSRNKSVGGVQGDLINTIEKSSRVWATMGASRALGGVFQPVKQVVPVALNTLINAGRLDLLTPFGSQDFHEWLDKSGLGIAGRGMESQSGFEDANRMLEDAAMSGNIAKVISSIEGASRFGLKYVLVNPDVWIARSSFKSYYIQGLKMRGESTDIDWKNHEVNVDAAQYAQHMVDRQQNVSDSALSGEFLTSSDPVRKIAKNVLFPFASFVLNQKSRMFADFSTITNRESSDQDRVSAARSLAGLATEMAVFQGISFSIRYLILNQIAQAITGHEPDDEEKEETLRRQLEYSAGTMVKDVFSPIPLTDSYAIDGGQYIFDLISNTFSDPRVDAEKALIEYNESLLKSDKSPLSDKDAEKWIEKFVEEKKFTIREYQNNQSAGMYGITLTKFNELMSAAKLAYEGEFERETPTGQKTKKYILDKDRDNLKNLFPALAVYNIIGFPAELSGLYRNVENHAKKTKSITEKQFETYKELGVKNPSIIEEYLIRNTRATENSSAAERIKEELDRIEKWSGKLNDDQMRKYIEIKETDGDVGLRDLTEL
jgi:hypothetical protein